LDESNTKSIYSQMFSESAFSTGVTTVSRKREHEDDDQDNKKIALEKSKGKDLLIIVTYWINK